MRCDKAKPAEVGHAILVPTASQIRLHPHLLNKCHVIAAGMPAVRNSTGRVSSHIGRIAVTRTRAPASIVCLVIAAMAAGCGDGIAQSYPARPIRLLLGYGAGGAADIVARVIGPRLSAKLGQQIVVDNRPGAGSIIATDLLARSNADGYTLMLANVSFGANSALHSKLAYDALRDFEAVGLVTVMPNVLVVHPSVAAKSPAEFIALAKSKPGQLNHAHAGIGSAGYLIAETLQYDAGINVVHISYQSGAQAAGAVLAGEAHFIFVTVPTTLSYINSGRIRVLAVTSAKRSAALPDTPTLAESVVPGFVVNEWHGVLAPRGTPRKIVQQLNGAVSSVLAIPEVQGRLAGLGAEPNASTPEQMSAFVKAEHDRWKKVLKPID
jgi:tripartite-type tricarboxylate transporter receptor subunit TctC